MIRPTDRVSAVIARDERLIDVFTSLAPTFERLRNPAMRRVMARLVTVEQAARVAGVDPDLLLERLNQALASGARSSNESLERTTSSEATSPGDSNSRGAGDPAPAPSPADSNGGSVMHAAPGQTELPAHLAELDADLIVDLDVRPDLRRGEEPFSKIMAAKREVPPGGVLRLRATFEPVPLYAVLGKQGMEHWTERLADDDWRVWFYSPIEEPEESVDATGTSARSANGLADPADSAEAGAGAEDDVVILDVRGLEPPEPMMRTFAALEELEVGQVLLQINVRVPQFLLPQLAARGFTWEVREQGRDLVRIFIRHAQDESEPA